MLTKKIITSVSLVLFTAVTYLPNAFAAGNAKEGKKIFEQNCAACHGLKGTGDGAAAAALNPKPRNFKEAKFKYGSTDADLHKTITNGKGSMPPWKAVLKPKQIDDVISYIRTLKGKK